MSKKQTNREPASDELPEGFGDDPISRKLKANADFGEAVDQIKADIDRVVDILEKLPLLKRYGGDENAVKEAREILEKVKALL